MSPAIPSPSLIGSVALTPPPPPPPPRSAYLSTGSATATGEPYPPINVLVAVLLTLAAPFISLIAAVVLLQDQRADARRSQLRSWAVASGVWLAVGGLIFIGVVASISGGVGGPDTSGPCKGGIDRLEPPSYESFDGQHWTAVYTCLDGGTLRRPSHAAWLNK